MNTEQSPHHPPWRFVRTPLVRGGLARVLDKNNSPVFYVPGPHNVRAQEDAVWVATAPDRERVYKSVTFQVGAFRDFIEDVYEFLGDHFNVADNQAVELHQRAEILMGYQRPEERLAQIESARVRM